MKIITSINAKGGCGKTTIASSIGASLARRGRRTLLIDMDPQAGLTSWFRLGDGVSVENSVASVLAGSQSLSEVIKKTHLSDLDFVTASAKLEDVGRVLMDKESYEKTLGFHLIRPEIYDTYDFVVIDSPNQVSPVMHNAICVTDLFIIPFLDTDSVTRYPNLFSAIRKIRPERDYSQLNVLTGLSKVGGKRKRTIEMLEEFGLTLADTEIRHCGWLGSISTEGGSIFEYRSSSNGAKDIDLLTDESLMHLGIDAPKIHILPDLSRYDGSGSSGLSTNPNTV